MARNDEEKVLPTAEEVLANEDSMLEGLLAAVKSIEETTRKVQIVRNKKVYFEFSVRPLSDEEIKDCLKACTKTYKNPQGRNLPRIDGETDIVAYKNKKIYTATTDEDKKKLWDNQKIKNQLGAFLPEDVIQVALLAGEKNKISDLIDEISGYDNADEISNEEYAKN